MIPLKEAEQIVAEKVCLLGTEEISLADSLGRVTAFEAVSDMDMPPFNKSAMDGFAFSSEDTSGKFEILETIAAGSLPSETITPGTCSRIMTGAPLPEGADCVVRVEYTEVDNEFMHIVNSEKQTNVCIKGEDVQTGDILLRSDTLITPPVMGALASVGYSKVSVYKKPVVAVIATGMEIVEPSVKPGPGQIRNSNSYQLAGQITGCGGVPILYRTAADEKEDIRDLFREAVADSDIIIFSGGVSMGDFDYVPSVLKESGVEILFEKIKVRPGSPTVFGTFGKVCVFGLPGNPVSTFVIFELLIRPVITQMQGLGSFFSSAAGTLTKDIKPNTKDRDRFIPVSINEKGDISPVDYHGSAHLGAYTDADGFLCIPSGGKPFVRGMKVTVRRIQ